MGLYLWGVLSHHIPVYSPHQTVALFQTFTKPKSHAEITIKKRQIDIQFLVKMAPYLGDTSCSRVKSPLLCAWSTACIVAAARPTGASEPPGWAGHPKS